jgi:hypothetical protein
MRRTILALAALVLICSASVVGSKTQVTSRKNVKQAGGSTGDSTVAGADTGSAVTVPKNVKDWWVIGYADSACRWELQASLDGGTTWFRAFYDSVALGVNPVQIPGGMTVAADSVYLKATSPGFGGRYAGTKVRIIQDIITAPLTTTRQNAWYFFRTED